MNSDQEFKDSLFHNIAEDIARTLAQKNADYGDSFHKVYQEFGDLSTFIRLMDKLGRLESFVRQHHMHVENESLEDVYKDIAGYCILTLASKRKIDAMHNRPTKL